MRLKMEIDDLTPDQWCRAQEILQVSYDMSDGASRACVTITHQGEERHVEMPVSRVPGLLMGLALTETLRELGRTVNEAMRHIRAPFQTVAGHNPDTGGAVAARDVQCSPACEAQDDDRPHHLECPTRKRDA
jgi:hypothetical protein